MKAETRTTTNRSGACVSLTFDDLNVFEDNDGIGIRIPTVLKSPRKGEASMNLLIMAYKTTYPTRELFLQQVERVGKQQVISWMKSSSDEGISLPPPDASTSWVLSIEGETDEEEDEF